MNHRPGATPSAGSQTVLPTVRFSPVTSVEFTPAANRCTAAGVSVRSSLDFLRILRAIIRSEHDSWDLLSLLDVIDQRSLMRLLDRGGVQQLCRDNRPTVEEFMSRQKFLQSRRLIEAIAARLKHS